MQDGPGLMMIVLGRLLLGGLYVAGGIHHFFVIVPLTDAIEARGIPLAKWVLLSGSLFQILAGTLLMLGLFVTAAAFGLIVFTLAATVMLLNFWDMQGTARESAINTWKTNMAIIGGLLITAAGPM
ncbi:quinol oxidase [Rhizobium leguminosarum bv. trifolii CB782]|uniref:DoxX family protein n=1 Tax=Rhizobium hidalgonense TaxID=1538159 RepID=A0A2A6KK31_9HYPH|nr:DoxX family protein [Rhizobium hidalgonense]AHG46778.1 quinol oxidase [Rhizobium leguminosarum bv. trifolii CB782]MDR9775212.1 DoxX family protein [Rhizobium hidalgonense]MDR9805872.1 DoxX family protein [Rhizobium hidalgonense]MDR9811808.1 DoxX family protein [Rhizobium hidalgonense]MDR9819954.1 DoxX family protein [Rhizobium hidalgonense]